MLPSKKINRLFRRLARRMSWPAMLSLAVMQTAITYFLFFLAGESELVNHPLALFLN
jgi:voltage-gated potassium channel